MRQLFLVACLLSAACKPPGPALYLQGDDPPMNMDSSPVPDRFVAIKLTSYGFQGTMMLVVGDDGQHERRAFVAPAAVPLKKGDVFTVERMCYRADERHAAMYPNEGTRQTDECTDVVTPYARPIAEAPAAPPPNPTDAPGSSPPPEPTANPQDLPSTPPGAGSAATPSPEGGQP